MYQKFGNERQFYLNMCVILRVWSYDGNIVHVFYFIFLGGECIGMLFYFEVLIKNW